MTITFTIANAIATRVINNFAAAYNYDGTEANKNTFVKQKIAEYIKAVVVDFESRAAATTARENTTATAEQEIVIS